jgi:Holliday junction DNA helicase RuvA
MITQLKGRITALSEDSVTVEINGLYYELMIPSGLHGELREASDKETEIILHTLDYIEAGERNSYHYPRLIGFTRAVDKDFFRLFTTVPGLGIRKGLKSLTLPIREIAAAIETKDADTLIRLPGFGRRLAEKAIAELHGKMARFALSKTEVPLTSIHKEKADIVADAVDVLVQLQYKLPEAEKRVENALKANPGIKSTEELISAIFSQETTSGKVVGQ